MYNSEDRYELYSSDLDTFKAKSQEEGYTNCIVFLEDPEAEELVAKRVIMDRYADIQGPAIYEGDNSPLRKANSFQTSIYAVT